MEIVESAHDHGETMRRLRAAVAASGLAEFGLIDHGAGARDVGLELNDEQVLLFGNPKAGTPLMQDDPRVGIELPLRMLVWASADGRARLGFSDPRALADRYEVSAHAAVLEQMHGLLTALAHQAAKS